MNGPLETSYLIALDQEAELDEHLAECQRLERATARDLTRAKLAEGMKAWARARAWRWICDLLDVSHPDSGEYLEAQKDLALEAWKEWNRTGYHCFPGRPGYRGVFRAPAAQVGRKRPGGGVR